jgi:hypothetical protein
VLHHDPHTSPTRHREGGHPPPGPAREHHIRAHEARGASCRSQEDGERGTRMGGGPIGSVAAAPIDPHARSSRLRRRPISTSRDTLSAWRSSTTASAATDPLLFPPRPASTSCAITNATRRGSRCGNAIRRSLSGRPARAGQDAISFTSKVTSTEGHALG